MDLQRLTCLFRNDADFNDVALRCHGPALDVRRVSCMRALFGYGLAHYIDVYAMADEYFACIGIRAHAAGRGTSALYQCAGARDAQLPRRH